MSHHKRYCIQKMAHLHQAPLPLQSKNISMSKLIKKKHVKVQKIDKNSRKNNGKHEISYEILMKISEISKKNM